MYIIQVFFFMHVAEDLQLSISWLWVQLNRKPRQAIKKLEETGNEIEPSAWPGLTAVEAHIK